MRKRISEQQTSMFYLNKNISSFFHKFCQYIFVVHYICCNNINQHVRADFITFHIETTLYCFPTVFFQVEYFDEIFGKPEMLCYIIYNFLSIDHHIFDDKIIKHIVG